MIGIITTTVLQSFVFPQSLLDLSCLKIGSPVTPALLNVRANFVFFSAPLCFYLVARAGQTDGPARHAMRPTGPNMNRN